MRNYEQPAIMVNRIFFDEEINTIERVFQWLLSLPARIYRVFKNFTGYIGVFVLIPVLVALAFCLWAILKYSNGRLKSILSQGMIQLNTENSRSLMLAHHSLKKRRESLDELIVKIRPMSNDFRFLFQPMLGQIVISRNLLSNAERSLHTTLYPQYHRALTAEHEEELKKISEAWSDLPVYSN